MRTRSGIMGKHLIVAAIAFLVLSCGEFNFGELIGYTPGTEEETIARVLWKKTIDWHDGNDFLNGVDIDGEGNVIAAGYYTATGDLQETAYAVKFDSSGNKEWDLEVEEGPVEEDVKSASHDRLQDVAAGSDGSFYLCGRLSGHWDGYSMGSYHDAFWVRKYSSGNDMLWEDVWQDGADSAWQVAYGLDLDGSGNIYVGGEALHDWVVEHEWVIRKYNPAGSSLWEPPVYYDYSDTYVVPDNCYRLCVDEEGNLLAAGIRGVEGTDGSPINDFDWHVRKYDSAQNLVWEDTYSGAAHLYDYAKGVAADADGNVYVAGYTNTGTSNTGSGVDYDWLVIKYSKNGSGGAGVRIWTYTFESASGASESCQTLTLASDGNLLVIGTKNEGENSTLRLIKLDSRDGSMMEEQNVMSAAGLGVYSMVRRGSMIALAGYEKIGDNHDMMVSLLEEIE